MNEHFNRREDVPINAQQLRTILSSHNFAQYTQNYVNLNHRSPFTFLNSFVSNVFNLRNSGRGLHRSSHNNSQRRSQHGSTTPIVVATNFYPNAQQIVEPGNQSTGHQPQSFYHQPTNHHMQQQPGQQYSLQGPPASSGSRTRMGPAGREARTSFGSSSSSRQTFSRHRN